MQGQFLSEDPVFLGNPSQQNLQDPQSLNAYSYAEDNPITKSDMNGKQTAPEIIVGAFAAFDYIESLILDYDYRSDVDSAPNGVLTPAQNREYDYQALKNIFFGFIPEASVETGLVQKGSEGEAIMTLLSEAANTGSNYISAPSQDTTQLYQTTPSTIEADISPSDFNLYQFDDLLIQAAQYQTTFPNLSTPTVSTNTLISTGLSGVYTSNSSTAPAGATYTASGALSTYPTPSGAVVSANGELISGPPQK